LEGEDYISNEVTNRMNGSIILISTLVIIWWIAVWGLIDIFLKDILGNSKKSYIMVYSAMIAVVIAALYMYPRLGESFV
jgi:hypothetical protein